MNSLVFEKNKKSTDDIFISGRSKTPKKHDFLPEKHDFYLHEEIMDVKRGS